MKLFLALVLIGVCTAGPGHHHVDFCKGKEVAEFVGVGVKTQIMKEIPRIIGHCESAKSAMEDGTFFGKHCRRAFDQAFCYGYDLYERYNVHEMLSDCTYGEGDRDYSVSLTYKDMAEVLKINGPVKKLGKLACEHALPCLEHLAVQLAECSANDDNFYLTALYNARDVLEPLILKHMGAFERGLICHFGADSDAMTLLSLVKEKITSFDDIVDLFNKHISSDVQDSILSGVRARVFDFIDGSNEFCDADCVSKSAKYFRKLFLATHDDDTCPTIEFYCGDCHDNAISFIQETASSVPCCTIDALDSIVSTIQSVFKEYGDLIRNIEAAVTEIVEESGVSTDGYESVKDAVMEQAECLNETYEELDNEGCMSA